MKKSEITKLGFLIVLVTGMAANAIQVTKAIEVSNQPKIELASVESNDESDLNDADEGTFERDGMLCTVKGESETCVTKK